MIHYSEYWIIFDFVLCFVFKKIRDEIYNEIDSFEFWY